MRKYIVAHSFLMFTSVLATKPFHVVRQAPGLSIGAPPPSGSVETSPVRSTTPVATSSSVETPPAPSNPLPVPSSSSTSSPTTLPASNSLPLTPSTSSATPTSSLPPTSLSTTPVLSDTASVTSISTDAAGSSITVTIAAPTTNASASSSSPSATSAPEDNSIHPGTIIGLSTAGGVAAIAIIAFIVWKLTRKRFSDLDDTGEAIKWPELNRDTHVGGSDGLSHRLSSTYSSGAASRNQSALDQSDPADPYAVPPLPQFNPNQPYRDDPYAASGAGYYDPYRGPIPQTFHDESVDGHESIPMSTYPPGSRSRSPGPGAAYDMGGRGSPVPGRASPAPGQAYDMGGRGSPAPGRTFSPGPVAALGPDRRQSPGPQYALSGQPEMAARNKGPGPNVLG